jgi:hypothetical protein
MMPQWFSCSDRHPPVLDCVLEQHYVGPFTASGGT